jgi:phospholipase/carboxylesterase
MIRRVLFGAACSLACCVAIVAGAGRVSSGDRSSADRSSTVAVMPNPASGVRTWEVGEGQRLFVLLHGYAASPEDWLPFVDTIRVRAGTRFIFPEAPEQTLPPDGRVGGRAWWRLALDTYRPTPTAPIDLSRAHPEGLVRAADRVRLAMQEVRQRRGAQATRTILGGFSQGAMISSEIAFESDEPLHALVLLSDTLIDEARLTAAMAKRRGLPVFIAHGRQDPVLPFASAQRLQRAMRHAGLRVTWFPFEGGHEIPAVVVDALNQFLASVH